MRTDYYFLLAYLVILAVVVEIKLVHSRAQDGRKASAEAIDRRAAIILPFGTALAFLLLGITALV